MSKDCKDCIHSRLILSENGYRACCTLPYKNAIDCIKNNNVNYCENLYTRWLGVSNGRVENDT